MKGKAKLESRLKLYKIMAVPTMRHKGKDKGKVVPEL
jgi:hypothetical protein